MGSKEKTKKDSDKKGSEENSKLLDKKRRYVSREKCEELLKVCIRQGNSHDSSSTQSFSDKLWLKGKNYLAVVVERDIKKKIDRYLFHQVDNCIVVIDNYGSVGWTEFLNIRDYNADGQSLLNENKIERIVNIDVVKQKKAEIYFLVRGQELKTTIDLQSIFLKLCEN